MEPEVLHIPELARMLGRSESAIRSALQVKAPWLPPFFRQGTRICWRVASVRKFLEDWENNGGTKEKPGRKRRPPPSLRDIAHAVT